MSHNILKDGNYIQYGPKIIPNPNAEGSGSGGGGDLSTCTLQVINQTSTGTQFTAPTVYDDDEYPLLTISPAILPNMTQTFIIVLYKNMCNISIDSSAFQINVSGNITSYGEPGIYYITGDGSITLTENG